MPPIFDVFLSHNGQDKPAVERIAERLRAAGFRPWLDKWELTPGGRWQDELHEGLQACGAFAYFLGPNGEGDWAREELDAARSRAAKDREFRIFPVLLPGTPDPFDRTTMPPFLGHRTWVDLRPGLDDPVGFQSFINAIKGVPLGAPEATSVVPGAGDVSPYRGLDAFDEADAGVFFGREPDIQQTLEQLKGSRFLAVLGPSGSGKSSLVRAGLVPALRTGALPGSAGWLIEIVKPGARPAEALAARLLGLGQGAGMAQTLDGLLTDERSLHLAGTLALGDAPDRRLVWVIDQAEELFTLCHDDAERAAVIGNLTYAASVPGGRTIVILAMRADFYVRAAAYPDLAAHIAHSQHLVAPLTPDGIRDAIEEPARTVGLEFEEGLVGTILDDLEGQPGSLPLLQYALLELWKRRRGGMLTLEGYRESGGVQGAIAKRAEAIYAAFTPEEQAIARRALLRLTQPGEGTEDTRRRASMRELVTRVDEAHEVEAVIGELTDARLLTASADPATGEGLVDISHEALIRAWPRVRQWLDEDRAGQRVLRRVTEATAEWTRLGRDEGILFRGARLAEAVEWRADHEDLLNTEERAFLDASAALQERERLARERARRRVTVAAGALAAVFLVLAGLAGLQWASAEAERRTAEDQRAQAEAARTEADRRAQEAGEQRTVAEDQRRLAEKRRLLAEEAQAESERARTEALARALGFKALQAETHRDRALLLALEATARADVPEINGLLLRELGDEPRLVRFVGDPGPAVSWLDVAADPARIAWIDVAGDIRVATVDDPDSPLFAATMEPGTTFTVALAPDGTWLVASNGTQVTAWDIADGRERWSVSPADLLEIDRMAFVSGDRDALALADDDGSVRLLDPATGATIGDPIPAETPLEDAPGLAPFGMAFSADGTRFARGEQDGRVTVFSTLDGSIVAGPLERSDTDTTPGPYRTIDMGFTPDGGQIVVLFADGFGLIEMVDEPTLVGALSTGVSDGLRIIITGDSGGFLMASANRGLRYLSFATLVSLVWDAVGARPFPYALDSTSDGRVLAGYPDGRLAIYQLADHWGLAERLAAVPPPAVGTPATDQAYAIRADGDAFAWYEQQAGAVRIHDAAGAEVARLPVDTWVEALALSDDGTRAVMVEDREEDAGWVGTLVSRSVPDGERLVERRLGPMGHRIALSADGTRVAIGDLRGNLWVEDLATGEVLWSAPEDPDRRAVTAVELSPDGRTLRAGVNRGTGPFGQTELVTWRLDQDAEPVRLPVDADRISAVATSPDGERVVIAGSDAQSWADGRLLVAGTDDRVVTGSLGLPGDDHAALHFAPDGSLLSGGPATGWFRWSVDPDDWRERACAVAARDLTLAEWREVLGDEAYRPTCGFGTVDPDVVEPIPPPADASPSPDAAPSPGPDAAASPPPLAPSAQLSPSATPGASTPRSRPSASIEP